MTYSKTKSKKASKQDVNDPSFLLFNQGFSPYPSLLASLDPSLLKSTQRAAHENRRQKASHWPTWAEKFK